MRALSVRHFWENKELLKIDTLALLKEVLPKDSISVNEPMSSHTSFRLGGNARFFVTPCKDEVAPLINVLRANDENYIVIGNGSNLLVSDAGFDGTVVCIGRNMSHAEVNGDKIIAMAGTLLSRIASLALKNSLTGFEFASGIPGSLGGAVVMNAGAYGGEMKDVVLKTEYVSANGEIKTVEGDGHGFGYRKSIFNRDDVILSSEIQLRHGNYEEIKAVSDDLNARRRDKQPLEYPSAGSTFKRPEGHFAAKLIDDAGLRGYKVGGAMVSKKHCGFVINYDNASAMDVFNLMKDVKNIVCDKFGVTLEPEVRFIGDFPDF